MFARIHRFHGYGSLNGVYRNGRTVRGPLIALRYAARNPHRSYRVAVVVSRKVSKSAVTRNHIRRRVYEVVRHQAELIPPGTDLIFTAFSEQLATIEPSKLEATITDLLKKAALLNTGQS